MMAARGDEYVAKFYCTKHSWRGKWVKCTQVDVRTSDHWISLLLITIMSAHKQEAVA